MTSAEHVALGAYLLGALDPRERAEVEHHLSECRRCRDEIADLAPLPGLMSRITVDEAISGPPPVDDAMLERLLAAATRERRTTAVRLRLVAVAAAVVLVGGSVGGVALYRSMTAASTHAVTASAGHVHLRVEMAAASNGTALTIWLSGVRAEEHCELVAVSDTGAREVASSWEATYSGSAVIKGTTAIPYAHLRQFVVQTYDGVELLRTNV
ncbi:MAG: zf-HC2 domain-containing protein [Frankiaceae bacterium]|nr:zf-HC2 domain-containing protein [Frankiaceae bacterium]